MANTDYTISRIFSEFNYGRWMIHKIGYTPDGKLVKVKTDFTDYFYFKSAEVSNLIPFERLDQNDYGDYTSIYGEPCRKIEYRSIKEKNQVVKQYPESTFEADVAPEFKYLMEMPQTWADAKDRHILYFDIETDAREKSSTPNRPEAPITSIQTYSTRFKKYFVFTWHPEKTVEFNTPKIIETEERTYIFCQNEYSVIEAFIAFIEEYSPDVITGWYSAGFDLPYIVNRCSRLNIDFNRLSPVGRVAHYQKRDKGEMVWKTYITGLDHVDMLEAVKDIGYNLPNYKLATAAKEILKDSESEKLTEVTWEDWADNFKGFIEYGVMDVKILKEIDEVLGIFELYCTIQKLTNITSLGEVMFKSSVVDKYILTESQGQYVFPTRKTVKRQKYMGAHVMDPVAGLHKDVAVFDYASLYPTSIMSFNLSPETFICSDKELERKGMTMDEVITNLKERNIHFVDTGDDPELFGGRYLFYAQDRKLGIFPQMLKKMYMERKAIKQQMKNETDELKINALDKHQQAIKLILNSSYGALGFNYFRLYKPEVADAITFFARQALYFGQEKLEEFGCDVIYQDTDSVAEDSKILLENGDVISIGELYNIGTPCGCNNDRLYANLNNINLPYYDENICKIKYGKANKIMKHKCKKKMFRITLENGKYVDVTEDHSLMVKNSSGKLEEKLTKDLNIRDTVIFISK